MTVPQPNVYRAATSIPELGAREGDVVAVLTNHIIVLRELPRSALTPAAAASLRPTS